MEIPVLYYISPQVWAWRPGRVRRIARRVDHMAVILPFEKDFKVYVWFDALINYITGANGNWPADLHVIGKKRY